MKTFRFDDVSINSNMELTNKITDYLFRKFPGCEIIWAISPMVHEGCEQRVFPKIFNALSDYKKTFFSPDKCGLPELRRNDVKIASHGLIHIDHRLLSYDQQEMSILISASLLGTKIFVPPFNKWNIDTQKIGCENQIKIIYFEQGWKSMEHHSYDKSNNWYLHAREWTLEKIKRWFGEARV